MTYKGLFIGMAAWDMVYTSERMPGSDEKLMAEDLFMAAGGPACNAAVTFSALGGEAALIGAVGRHPIASMIKEEIGKHGVLLMDLAPDDDEAPPVSSIIITESTGNRAVISRAARVVNRIPGIQEPDVIMIDGHQMEASAGIMEKFEAAPVVVDAGSYKQGFDKILSKATYVLCSADFHPPGVEDEDAVFDYLLDLGVENAAVTHGPGAVRFMEGEDAGWLEVPEVRAVDTTGAGDIFHGAFSRYILENDFITALNHAAELASFSCRYRGTREWMTGKKEFQTY